jgi:hypothetical protein
VRGCEIVGYVRHSDHIGPAFPLQFVHRDPIRGRRRGGQRCALQRGDKRAVQKAGSLAVKNKKNHFACTNQKTQTRGFLLVPGEKRRKCSAGGQNCRAPFEIERAGGGRRKVLGIFPRGPPFKTVSAANGSGGADATESCEASGPLGPG